MSAALPLLGWSTIRLVGDHVWQSTLVAAVAGLLTFAFRHNRADVRHGVWFAASLKFLVPFAALAAAGSHFGWRSASRQPAVTWVFDAVSQPFFQPAFQRASASMAAGSTSRLASAVPLLLLAIWGCGCMAILTMWCVRWRRVALMVDAASRVEDSRELAILRRLEHVAGITKPIGLVSTSGSLEPGIFGIVHRVLLWPRSLGEQLSDEHVEAILAHELAHVQRRDNLTATLQMLVEALFWFHPLVWWLGARLVDERERACDEAVVRLGSQPQIYAESLLKTCEYHVKSPLVCVAGVTGSNLKRRIERIMTNRGADALRSWKKLVLAAAGAAAIAVPIVFGALDAPRLYAQSPAGAPPLAFESASIKPSIGGPLLVAIPPPFVGFLPPPRGHFVILRASLGSLIPQAYELSPFEMSGGPDWMESDAFDIVATIPDDAFRAGVQDVMNHSNSRDQMGVMLRTLLAQRFKLDVHHERRELPVYTLVRSHIYSGLGPSLVRSTRDCAAEPPLDLHETLKVVAQLVPLCGDFFHRPHYLAGTAVELSRLAVELPTWGAVDRTVVDRTGLTGTFDFDLTWSPQPDAIFINAQEQLGLRLESANEQIDVLIVDRAEHPTPN